MIAHATDVIPLLLWLIVGVGSGLVGLLIWIGQRLQNKVDALPDQVAGQVVKIHEEIIGKMDRMNEIHGQLERDVREQVSTLDRRITVLEVRCGMHHTGQ